MPNRVGAFSTFAGLAPPWSLPNLDANFSAITTGFNDASLGYVNYIGSDTGSVNNYVVTCSFGTPSAYNAGMFISFAPANTNTGSSTITVNPLTSIPIRRADGTALSGGELIVGMMTSMIYDGSAFRIMSSAAASVPTGTIIMHGYGAAIPGYLACDGTAYNRTIYAPLFNLIGTSYGPGDGSTTFNVPNYSTGRFPLWGTPGTTGGASSVTLAIANLPPHNHPVTATDSGHYHIYAQWQSGVSGDNSAAGTDIKLNAITGNTGVGYANISASSGNTGSGAAFSIMPSYLCSIFLIKT